MSSLPVPSAQQLEAIELACRRDTHVWINAVPGSGKTTTLAHIAKKLPDLHFALVTYNRQLRDDTRARLAACGITNVVVQTYHSLCKRFYDRTSGSFKDDLIENVLRNDIHPLEPSTTRFDYLLLDEQQDCAHLYHALACKVIRDLCKPNTVFVVVGDHRQNVYAYKGTDARFLTLSPFIYPPSNHGIRWTSCRLTETRRCTRHIARFVERCVMTGEVGQFVSTNEPHARDVPVDYVVVNMFGNENKIVDRLEARCKLIGCSMYDVMIIVPSLRNTLCAAHILQRALTARGYSCYVPGNGSDDCEMSENAMKNKIIFSTFHQSKGREAPIVVVLGFDMSYFRFFDREGDPTRCSPPLFVAATRAKTYMMLVHHCQNEALSFLPDLVTLRQYVEYLELDPLEIKTRPPLTVCPQEVSVTDLLRHIPDKFKAHLLQNHTFRQVAPRGKIIDVPALVESTVDESMEEVADINGIVATTLMDLACHGFRRLTSVMRNVKRIPTHGLFHDHPKILARRDAIFDQWHTEDLDPDDKEDKEEKKDASSSMSCDGYDDDDDGLWMDIDEDEDYDDDCYKHEIDSIVHDQVVSNDELSSQIVFLCTLNQAVQSKYNARAIQLKRFDWWTRSHREAVLRRLLADEMISGGIKSIFEAPLSDGCRRLRGYVDIIVEHADGKFCLYEIKCANRALDETDKLQVMLYLYLWAMHAGDHVARTTECVLFNVCTGEKLVYDVPYDANKVGTVVDGLLRRRAREGSTDIDRSDTRKSSDLTDVEFIASVGDAFVKTMLADDEK